VLRADQLLTLLRGRPDKVESVVSCTPQDFGLTEVEMSAYDTRRQSRRQRMDLGVLTPLDAALEQRLHQLQQVQRQRPLSNVQTGRRVPLFNPRRDRWHDHFRRSRDQVRLYGRTAIGRATVALLRLNSVDEQRTKQIQRDYLSDIFPLS
jgi:hypothetical protein